MQLEVEHRLRDILAAGEDIQAFIAGLSLGDYLQSRMIRSAVERQLITVGEALTVALRRDPSLRDRITQAREIIAFRNMVVHGYSRIDNNHVWGTIRNKLPLLLSEVRALLPPAP
jgi:uncharacterized protein with HEPN domain